MKKYIFLLLAILVTTVVFSRPVDRPPDLNETGVEFAILPEVICSIEMEQFIDLTISIQIETKKLECLTAYIESEATKPEPKKRYLKIAGTENEQYGNNGVSNLHKALTKEGHAAPISLINVELPRIRSPV